MATDTASSGAPFISRCGQSIQKGYGVMSDAIVKLLGMSQEQIQTEREAGKSIAEIAQEKKYQRTDTDWRYAGSKKAKSAGSRK
jgi:hypothetical protein